jgi:Tfp pilus assembly protein PilN
MITKKLTQTINLLSHLPKKRGKQPLFKHTLSYIGLTAAILVAISVFTSSYTAMKAEELKESKATLAARQMEITQIERRPNKEGNQYIATLPPNSKINFKGFYPLLHDLASQYFQDVWLTEINLSYSDDLIVFKGYANSSTAIQGFLVKLKSLPSFKDQTFKLFMIHSAKDTTAEKNQTTTKSTTVSKFQKVYHQSGAKLRNKAGVANAPYFFILQNDIPKLSGRR